MKTEPSDPPRIGEQDSGSLGHLLRSARRRGPSDDLVERVSNRQGALATTDEHARACPKGEFTQERELSAVEALARMGRREEARSRAQQRYPRTPYAARLEKAVGPLSGTTDARPTPGDSDGRTTGTTEAEGPSERAHSANPEKTESSRADSAE